MVGMMNGGVDDARLVEVRFVTKLPSSLKVPMTSMKLSTKLVRAELSEIVNYLLLSMDSEFKQIAFDFIVNGEFIRIPLEEFLLRNGISTERVLEIEYVKAVVPREDDPLPHDDWVSAVDGSHPSFIASGCYDGYARLWKEGYQCSHVLEGHSGAISSICIIKENDSRNSNNLHIVTASKDRDLKLWQINADSTIDHLTKVRSLKTFHGHTGSVQCVSGVPSGDMVCSGSWDSSIKLWNVGDETEDDLVIKKRKVHTIGGGLNEESHLEGTSISTLKGHTECVSAVVWTERETIYSASFDHSVKRWDVQTGKHTWNLASGKLLRCIDVGGESSALVAAGGADSIIRVWDPRKPDTLTPTFKFMSHSSWISACKWHKSSWYHLLSSSYDGKVMLWDIRTLCCLAVMDSHSGEKVLCADWWKDDSIISGGADSKLSISSRISIS
ncbi:Ribosome biogenesis protein Ytm1 [Zostera marina]|uniref:Ribosome biogenesis protein WDR12 homolog n=1 Tax=Zostera marina TaxID=29655 RepID=A0A0K9P9V4_ZOSMR|nr:Ribosome biogenesis protein Ytm1 [Zostera marina]